MTIDCGAQVHILQRPKEIILLINDDLHTLLETTTIDHTIEEMPGGTAWWTTIAWSAGEKKISDCLTPSLAGILFLVVQATNSLFAIS